ncbi:type VII secretion-associated serine protease mycosin [Actinophytocola xanthii]|nr:type VII secretion-associated serine protease mycosin [Actinophytocola xanthii]
MNGTTTTARLLAATLLAVLVPAAPVAGAQPQDSQPNGTQAEQDAGPTPPPLTDRIKPENDGQPDRPYTRTSVGCVTSLDGNVQLQEKAWGQDVLRFQDLSAFATGANQTVAVIDTGVNQHDYLAGRLEGGGDYVEAGGDGLSDCDGHGTQVAGIIAAKPPSDDIGFRGIAPDAKILSIRQSSEFYEYKPPQGSQEEGRASAGSLDTLAEAVVEAADRNVDVINMSVDTCRAAANVPITASERNLQRALRYAVEEKDVVLVSSAGNIPGPNCREQNNSDPANPRFIVSPPWFSEYVLSVAAVDRSGDPAGFSMHGPWVSVAAPGTEIISLNPGDRDGLVNVTADEKGEQTPIQGTSFAAPYVAGLAALVRERFEKLGQPLTAKQIMERIKITAAHPAANGGHNIQVGYGMVNPVSALTTMIPAEENIPPDEAVEVPFEMPPPHERDWAPVQVAVIGSAGGLGLLLLTLFVVHTVRRQRGDRPDLS